MPALDWIGRTAVVGHHRRIPFRLLRCEPRLSVGDAASGNLLVHGDNLEALKALLPRYGGQVDLAYIDPPYNTGNEGWVYNDSVNSPEIRRWLGTVVGPEGEDLSRHDKWLCMMYPRLALLREMLKQTGVLVVHIDEHEVASLILMLDEIFGRANSLGHVVWDKGNPKGDAEGVAFQHETIVVYARDAKALSASREIARPKPNAERMLAKASACLAKLGRRALPDDLAEVAKQYKLPRGCVEAHERPYDLATAAAEYARWVKSNPDLSGGERMYSRIDSTHRVYRLVSMAWPNKKKAPDDYFEPLIHPVTGRPCPVPARGWRSPPSTMAELLRSGLIEFGPDHTTQPQRKYFLDENMTENLPSVLKYAGSDDALLAAMGLDFPNAKPLRFAEQLIAAFAPTDALVIDSFAGSGTSGHAVLQLNRRDGGTRRFIAVEMDERICTDLTRRRLQIAVEGQGSGGHDTRAIFEPLGGGVRFCRLGAPLFGADGTVSGEVSYAELAQHVYFMETGVPLSTPLDLESPLIGVHRNVAYYLLFNGVLGDRRPEAGNILTTAVLDALPAHAGPKVVMGEGCRLSPSRLHRSSVVFKQIPYQLKIG